MTSQEQLMIQALDAIHDEALRLLNLDVNHDSKIKSGLNLIVSIARYRNDVRSTEERRGDTAYP